MIGFQNSLAQDLYVTELQYLDNWGEEVEVRGRKTIEILDVYTEIFNPQHHCILIPERRWNPWIALSEALWIIAGRNDVEVLRPYNRRIGDYSDDSTTLYGAYGKRLYSQIDPLIERLRADSSDRRGVLSIWDARSTLDRVPIDLVAQTKDSPCNDMVMFKLRNKELHMTVINRSNDIHWGLYAVNLPTFGLLQEYIAARLGVGMGHQTHLSNSFHYYTDEPDAVAINERMKNAKPVHYPKHELAFKDLQDWTHPRFAALCSQVLDEAMKTENEVMTLKHPIPGFMWFALKFLWSYRTKTFKAEEFREYYPQYEDWILAGEIFTKQVWKHD